MHWVDSAGALARLTLLNYNTKPLISQVNQVSEIIKEVNPPYHLWYIDRAQS